MDNSGISHDLKYQARALSALKGHTASSRWIAGTNALREDNVIEVLEFDPETDAVRVIASYQHSQEVWHLAPHPKNTQNLFTISNQGGAHTAKLWEVQGQHLEPKAELNAGTGTPKAVLWNPEGQQNAICIQDSRWQLWDLQATANMTGDVGAGDAYTFWNGAWDVHDSNRLCTAGGNSVQVWDVRSLKRTGEIKDAHMMPIRDVDFAHQQQHKIVTGGDDCQVCVWDLRTLGGNMVPVAQFGGHSHWVWQTAYNPQYDSLLLSASSDAQVHLWYHSSALDSSSKAGSKGASASSSQSRTYGKDSQKGKAYSFDDHEDSVYCAAWSWTDPWLFASLSYDGRFVVNRVPNQTKYKVLL